MKRYVIRRKTIEPKSTANSDPDPRDGGVQSVDRALLIIETLAEDDEGYRLTDLAVRTGLSPSTVHRLLTTLEKRRFVQFDRGESTWHIGAQSFAVGSTFVRRRNFVTQALPYLRKLRDQTRETANLAVPIFASFAIRRARRQTSPSSMTAQWLFSPGSKAGKSCDPSPKSAAGSRWWPRGSARPCLRPIPNRMCSRSSSVTVCPG